MTISKTEKLLKALETGKNITAETLSRRTGLVNVSSTVDRLRQEGYAIYSNRKGTAGNKFQAYRLAS